MSSTDTQAATVQIVGHYPANDPLAPQYAAVCEVCGHKGIPSLFRFYAEADARDHNAEHHGTAKRRVSLLIDRVQA
jgi:hypothetical protein